MAAKHDRQIDDIRDLWAEDGPGTRSADPGAGSDLEALVIETIEALAAKGIGADDIEPLSRLRTAVRSFATDAEPVERRSGGVPASDAVLARVCVVIDLLIQAGYTHDKAVQMMARQLMLSNVVLPNSGGTRVAGSAFPTGTAILFTDSSQQMRPLNRRHSAMSLPQYLRRSV